MNNKDNIKDLLNTLSADMSSEDALLAGLQGIIAGTISMKRQLLGMSQKDLAKKLKVSQSLVSRWERAEANFTLESLIRIASALDLQVQSPIVPATPNVYSVGNSNVYKFPASKASWQTTAYLPPIDYIAKEN